LISVPFGAVNLSEQFRLDAQLQKWKKNNHLGLRVF